MAATLQTFGGGTTDLIFDPSTGGLQANTPYTIVDAVTMLPATGLLDASGMSVTQLVSDADGRFAGSAMLEGAQFYIRTVGASGKSYTWGPQVSTQAVADTLALAPQLNSIASSAAASALSAKQAQAAAQGAADKASGLIPLDVTKTTPQFLTSLTLTGGDVFQYAYKDPTTGQFYVSMNAPGTATGRETATLCRCGPDGKLLDYMTLTDAGHGANLVFERVGSDMFVYINWQEALSGGSGNQLVRFQYRAGATLTRAQTSYFTTVPKFVAGAQSTNIAVDWANDWVAQRISVDSTHDTYVRRRWSEMLAGVDKVYNTVGPIVVNPPTMQGMATLGDNLYFYSGTGSVADSEPNQLQRVSWATGQVTATVDTAPLGLVNGVAPGSYNEPEGVSVYVDPATGAASLVVGVVTGVKGARNYNLFTFSPPVGGLAAGLLDLSGKVPQSRLPDLPPKTPTFTVAQYTNASPAYRYSVTRVHLGRFTPGIIGKTYAYDYEKTWTPAAGTFKPQPRETMAEFQARLQPSVMVNGDGWSTTAPNDGNITGLQIKDGVLYNDFSATPKGRHALGILADGRFKIYDVSKGDTAAKALAEGVVHTFVWGPPLVKDGVTQDLTVIAPDTEWTGPYDITSRTILGQTATGDIILIAIEGSRAASAGAGGNELCRLAAQYGCYQAILLDGGGSTQMNANGSVVVASSDATPRPLASVLSINAVPVDLKADVGYAAAKPAYTPVTPTVPAGITVTTNKFRVVTMTGGAKFLSVKASFTGVTAASTVLCTFPDGARPAADWLYFDCPVVNGTTPQTAQLTFKTTGEFFINRKSAAFLAGDRYDIYMMFDITE